MKVRTLAVLPAALLLLACERPVQESPDTASDCIGDVNLITYTTTSSEKGNGSSGSSSGRNMLQETVLDQDETGLTLRVDLTDEIPPAERLKQWQFPAVIHRAPDGALSLKNSDDLETRLEAWLELGGFEREHCGEWIFTWNAFEIICDPDSAVEMYSLFDMRRFELWDGALFKSDLARTPARLRREGEDSGFPAMFKTDLTVDPDIIREQLAEQDVIVAGFVSETPLSLEEAIAARAKDEISGTLAVSFYVDDNGRLVHQTTEQKMTVVDTEGQMSRTEANVTVERELVGSDREAGHCSSPT